MEFPLPVDETERLGVLRAYDVLDTPPEAAFERITALAARLLKMPVTLVSLVDVERQWFKSTCGLNVRELPRATSFCTHAIMGEEVFVVPDATLDPRFSANPLVTGPMGLRFYAGAPLCTPDGRHRVGTLCAIDFRPRELDLAGQQILSDLAAIVVDELELRLQTRRRLEAEEALSREHARRFRQLVEQASDAFLIHDFDGRLVDVNQAACDGLGYTREELLRLSLGDIETPFDPEASRSRWEAMTPGQAVSMATDHRRKDGSVFPVEARVSVLPADEAGRRLLFALVRDVTERHRAERALREAHDRLEQRVAERTGELAHTNAELRSALGENLRLAAAIDGVSVGVIIVDAQAEDHPIRFANPAFLDITGYTLAEVIGRNCRFLQGTGTSREVADQIGTAIQAGLPFHGTLRNYRKDGTPYWNELTINPIRDADGLVQHFVGIQVDVTEERQVEERLRLLESVVVNSNDAVIITEAEPVDATGPRILYTNRAFERMTGYPAAETLGRSPRFLQGPATSGATKAKIQSALRGWQPVREDLVNYRKDGTEFWVELNIVPVTDERGRFTHWVSVQRDITERKGAEEGLRASQARYERVTANVPGMVYQFVLRADGSVHFPFVSEGCREIYGLEPEAIRQDARAILDLVCPEDRESFTRSTRETISTLQPWRWEGSIQLANNGPIKYLQMASRPERQANGDIVWDGVVVDVTERRRSEALLHAKEAAERANMAKSEFLSRMSHELRTPLNAILGFGQLLEMDSLTVRQSQSVEHILHGGRHLLTLVNEVLDIAQIESGRLALVPETLEVVPLIEETICLVRPLAAQHGVNLRVHPFPPQGITPVDVDRGRLTQILLNLLSNAIKYNRPGGEVELRCDEVAAAPRPGGTPAAAGGGGESRLRFTVRDTGKGISAELLDKLFVPFERLDAVHGSVEGTGLGLSVCKRLAEAMGGAIGVESAPGVGSTFWVEVPRAAT